MLSARLKMSEIGAASFDHLVSGVQQAQRHVKAKRICRL
jgi:hypothetical protein